MYVSHKANGKISDTKNRNGLHRPLTNGAKGTRQQRTHLPARGLRSTY
uniref:Uncharacterized protein n=1 Tax=Zea mays TaxID=4577 RepID=C4J1X3_MAIZE|nr:unknown [Zea mays]